MSSIFVAYNRKKIDHTDRIKISGILDFNEHKDIKKNEIDLEDISQYRQFGKVQVIYPRHKGYKFNIFNDERYLIGICGMIHNENKLLLNYKCETIFHCIINASQKGMKGIADFFSSTYGQFAIFFYDLEKDYTYIVNDKLGFFPAYYFDETDNGFIYSSRAEAVAYFLGKSSVINHDAIADYLTLGIVQNQETFLRNVNNLPAASILSKNGDRRGEIRKYFKFKYDDNSYSRSEYLPMVNNTLKKVIGELYNIPGSSCKRVCLTGGFDTRLINSVLLESGEKQTVTFTRHSLERESEINKLAMMTDEKIGREFAKKFNLDYHLKHIITNPNQRQKDYFEIHGLFGGELFGGEAYNQPATLFRMKIPSTGKIHFLTNRFKNLLTRDSIELYYENVSKIDCEEWEKKVFIYKAMTVLTTFFNGLERFGNIAWQYPHLFFKEDKISGAKMSLYPYLDVRFLEVLFKIPFYELDQRVFYSALLEKYYSKYLKVNILHGRKRLYGFNKETKKLFLYKKIEEEIKLKKNEEIIDEETRRKKAIRNFMDYLNNPVDMKNIDKGFFFHKKVLISERDLLFHRIENLQKWFEFYIQPGVL